MIDTKLKVVKTTITDPQTGEACGIDWRLLFNDKVWALTAREMAMFPKGMIQKDRRLRCRVFLKDVTITKHLSNGARLVYWIKRGHVTDLASVPENLEGFVGSDDQRIVVAAILHDIDFGTQLVEFRTANRHFYQAIRCNGGGRYFATKAFLPVSGRIGRGCYKDKERSFNTARKFVKLTIHGEL